MTLAPFLSAPPAIQVHMAAAVLAVLLGPLALYRARRDLLHKVLGYSWILAMTTVAVSALFIDAVIGIGHFGVLHLLVPVTFVSLFSGLRHAMARRIEDHRAVMRGLYWNGLTIAGLFAFLPNRRLNRSLFAEMPELGYVVIAGGVALLIWRNSASARRGREARAG